MNKSGLRYTAEFLMKIHWLIMETPGARLYDSLNKNISTHFNNLKNKVSYLIWKQTRHRPSLNTDAVSHMLKQFNTESIESPSEQKAFNLIKGRLKAHVAFHLMPARMKYLLETLRQLRELPFEQIHITVDTNSTLTKSLLQKYAPDLSVDVVVHEKLDHPFLLTWTHREQMKDAFPEFDYFMYTEDDILVTGNSIDLWSRLLPSLTKNNYLPGFLRVEQNRENQLVSSDFIHRATPSDIVHVDGTPYLLNPFPYQAFWIYNKETMARFMDSKAFKYGDIESNICRSRENAALAYTNHPKWNSFSPQHLLPLAANLQVDPRCFVFHTPSNYGRLIVPHGANLGTFRVESLVDHQSSALRTNA